VNGYSGHSLSDADVRARRDSSISGGRPRPYLSPLGFRQYEVQISILDETTNPIPLGWPCSVERSNAQIEAGQTAPFLLRLRASMDGMCGMRARRNGAEPVREPVRESVCEA